MFAPGCSPVSTPCRYCYRRGLCCHRGHVRPESLFYYRGSCIRALATAIVVGCVRTGPVCKPEATAIALCYFGNGVVFARNRCYTIVGYVYPLSLLVLSPWAVFAPGSCSPVCIPCHYCYRRGLCSHRGHVRLCVHPVTTAIAVDLSAPGSCSPVCATCRYCYRRGLCSPRGHVRPCSLLSLAIAGVGNPVAAAALPYVSASSLRTVFTLRDEQVRS